MKTRAAELSAIPDDGFIVPGSRAAGPAHLVLTFSLHEPITDLNNFVSQPGRLLDNWRLDSAVDAPSKVFDTPSQARLIGVLQRISKQCAAPDRRTRIDRLDPSRVLGLRDYLVRILPCRA
jgi:hypothetical protein